MPVRTSLSEPSTRDPTTLTARRNNITNGAQSTAIRNSVLDAYRELGALDENSYIADWIFNDTADTVEELEASYRHRVRFPPQPLTPHNGAESVGGDTDKANEDGRGASTFLRLLRLRKKKQQDENKVKGRKLKRASMPAPGSGKKEENGEEPDEGYVSASSARRRSGRFLPTLGRRKSKDAARAPTPPRRLSSSSSARHPVPVSEQVTSPPEETSAELGVLPKKGEEPKANPTTTTTTPAAAPASAHPSITEKSSRRWSWSNLAPKSVKKRRSTSAGETSTPVHVQASSEPTPSGTQAQDEALQSSSGHQQAASAPPDTQAASALPDTQTEPAAADTQAEPAATETQTEPAAAPDTQAEPAATKTQTELAAAADTQAEPASTETQTEPAPADTQAEPASADKHGQAKTVTAPDATQKPDSEASADADPEDAAWETMSKSDAHSMEAPPSKNKKPNVFKRGRKRLSLQ